MRLRALFGGGVVTLGGIVAVSAAALVAVTTQMDQRAGELADSSAGIRAAEGLVRNLLVVDREDHLLDVTGDARHRESRDQAERSLESWQHEVGQHVGSAEEREIVEETDHAIDLYLQDVRRADHRREGDEVVSHAVRAATRLADYNEDEALQARVASDRWEKLSRYGAALVVALLAAGAMLVLTALRRHVIEPLIDLRGGIEDFSRDPRTNVPERGARELAEIGHAFNESAAALRRQKDAELAFLAGVAHDLRNPLGALKTALGGLSAGTAKDPHRLTRVIALLGRQVDRLDRMVGDLLDRTRIESGRLELDRKPRDVRELVDGVHQLFRDASPRHSIEVHHCAEALVARIDEVRIEQVLNNLVSNAIKYSPSGGTVRISTARDGHELVIEVRDQGLGIPPEEHKTIFQPFRRSRSATREIPGVGLGLSVSRRIVEAHGGSIELTSDSGKGSTFRVRLPVDAAEGVRPHAH